MVQRLGTVLQITGSVKTRHTFLAQNVELINLLRGQ